MGNKLFPKPAPTKPLPEDVWLARTDRSEAGREPFFFGRDADYRVFRSAATNLHAGVSGGGIIVFQGAPGAGKSALMLECMEAVKQHSTPHHPWAAVFVRPATLISPADVVLDLINATNQESKRLLRISPNGIAQKFNKLLKLGTRLYKELSERGFSMAGLSAGGKAEISSPPDINITSSRIFSNAAPLLKKFRLVVFVDEAQNIPVTDATQGVMDCLHNPPKEIPLMAVFFGLSNTLEVLRECGISRFADERAINLEPLSIADATNSLQYMLHTYYSGKDEEKALWARALGELSQGWPQHMSRVGVAAGRVIRENKGHLQEHLLDQALAKGGERKSDYCAGRLSAGSQDPHLYKQLARAADDHRDGILSRKQLRHLAASALEESQESFDDFLTNALRAGLLAPVTGLPFHYRFPIPSMSDYLRELPV